MTTGEIVAVGAAVAALGGGLVYVLHKQNAAALQAAAAAQASAARAAAGAKNDWDLGKTLTTLGGHAIDAGLAYLLGGAPGVAAAQAKSSAVLV